MSYVCKIKDNFYVSFSTNYIKSSVESIIEHYKNSKSSVFIDINNGYEGFVNTTQHFSNFNLIYYDMEHKYPINENGELVRISPYWINVFNEMLNYYDEIWDFQLENYEYFKYYKLDKLFRFKPLRYTNWFEQFRKKQSEYVYEIQLEMNLTTQFRQNLFSKLTCGPVKQVNGYNILPDISINFTNTNDINAKFYAKNNCKYGIDLPSRETPITFNCFRIYEYICMNKPCIVCDPYKITSRKYFNDLCIYMDYLENYDLKQILLKPPRTDIAETFKQMTYSDKDYDEYRLNIIKDYKDRTGISVPDYVMY